MKYLLTLIILIPLKTIACSAFFNDGETKYLEYLKIMGFLETIEDFLEHHQNIKMQKLTLKLTLK